jgi:hypothetical protein
MTPEHQALIQQVAAGLGFVARADERSWHPTFTMPDGGSFHGLDSRQRGKLTFSCWVAHDLSPHKPYFQNGDAPTTEINCSDTKSAERIIEDVRRRLLPEYERLLADCRKGKAAHDEYCADQQSVAGQLAGIFGIEVKTNNDGTVQNLHVSAGSVYATLRIQSGSIYFERVDVPIACALEIAQALRKFMFEEKAAA